jgi:hypothetical protein
MKQKEIKKRTTLTVATRAAAFVIQVKEKTGQVWQNKNLAEGDEITIGPDSNEQDHYLCSFPGLPTLFIVSKEKIHKLLSDQYLEEDTTGLAGQQSQEWTSESIGNS